MYLQNIYIWYRRVELVLALWKSPLPHNACQQLCIHLVLHWLGKSRKEGISWIQNNQDISLFLLPENVAITYWISIKCSVQTSSASGESTLLLILQTWSNSCSCGYVGVRSSSVSCVLNCLQSAGCRLGHDCLNRRKTFVSAEIQPWPGHTHTTRAHATLHKVQIDTIEVWWSHSRIHVSSLPSKTTNNLSKFRFPPPQTKILSIKFPSEVWCDIFSFLCDTPQKWQNSIILLRSEVFNSKGWDHFWWNARKKCWSRNYY